MKKWAYEFPELYKQYLEEESHNAAFEKSQNLSSVFLADTLVHVIPVVFHIVEDNGTEDISDVQVFDAIRIFNEDYRKWNADTVDIIPEFKSVAGKVHFEFRLAEIDPNGNPTNGIVRRQSTYTNDPNQQYESQVKSDRWPQNEYLNIWSCRDIGGAAGYSYLPPSLYYQGYWRDGIMVLHSHVGSLGTGSPTNSRTLSHEAGHWSNLSHPWGPGNDVGTSCGDDGVGDTPETMGWQYCSLNGSVCNPPVIENVQNHMDYSYCSNMFTNGQVTRMRNSVEAATASRNNLWKASNLTATGVDDNKVVFFASSTHVCPGTEVQFADYSYNGMKRWSWSFPGGSPSASALKNPVVTYSVPGVYSVSLTAMSSSDTVSLTKNGYVVVAAPLTLPYYEGFENGLNAEVRNRWGGNSWKTTSTAQYYGSYSLMLSQTDNPVYKDMEEFASPAIDLSPLASSITMRFKTAYVQKSSQTNDLLRLSISANCGETWSPIWIKSGSTLASAPQQTSAFAPADTTQWKSWTVSLVAPWDQFRYRFEFTSDDGNNIYIDDITITGTYGNIPILVFPANYSMDIPVSSVKLDWNAVAAVDSYHVHMDTSFSFSSPWLVSHYNAYISSSNTGTDTEYDLSAPDTATTYYWRVRTYKNGLPNQWSSVWRFTTQFPSSVMPGVRPALMYFDVFPNPVSGSTLVSFILQSGNDVSLILTDIAGRQTPLIENKHFPPGKHAYDLPEIKHPGIYLLQLRIGDQIFCRRIIAE